MAFLLSFEIVNMKHSLMLYWTHMEQDFLWMERVEVTLTVFLKHMGRLNFGSNSNFKVGWLG